MAVRLCPWMDWLEIAPCIFRTSHIHVGRIPQGAMDGDAVTSFVDQAFSLIPHQPAAG
jgi:hypothetical protein